MPRWTSLFVLVLALSSGLAFAQKPPADKAQEPPAKSVDWGGLRELLEAADYVKAIDAADAILVLVQPNKKSLDFLPRCVDTIDALMRRGFAEFRLGRLDAADATFAATQAVFQDREFQKQLSAVEKQVESLEKQDGDTKLAASLVDLDLRLIELQNLRSAVCLERLRLMQDPRGPTSSAAQAPDPAKIEAVRGQVAAIQGFIRASDDIRKKIAERFEKCGPSVVGSPHKKTLMSVFHPELIAGIAAYEMSLLSFDVPSVPETEEAKDKKVDDSRKVLAVNGLDRGQLLDVCLTHFEAASKALDRVIEETLPKGIANAAADKRGEAQILLVRLSLARSAASLRLGNLENAQKDVDTVLDIHKDWAVSRKLVNTDSHPELIVPLLLATEIALGKSDEQSKAGMGDEARGMAAKASEILAKASALPLPEDHPRRQDLARLAAAIENRRAKFEASVVTTDAAEVAARRMRRAVEGTANGL